MKVTAIKTHKITDKDINILDILATYITTLEEKSIVAISSKIVSICEGRIVEADENTKNELAEKEADLYLPRTSNKYGVMVSIKNGMFIASAGIDESNGNGYAILWPIDPQASANRIREFLMDKFDLRHVGVIITDSRSLPLQWGVTGVSIASSGFAYLNSYVGKPDIFGRPLHVEKVNVANTLAAAAVGVMGEGEEQTPLACITDASFVDFAITPGVEDVLHQPFSLEDDMFAGLLTKGDWKKGKNFR